MTAFVFIVLWIFLAVLVVIRICTFRRPVRQESGLDIGACMTIGNREIQEDFYGLKQTPSGLLAVLADGMGKAYGGRIASRTAVETFKEIFGDYNAFDNPPYFFRKAFNSANREVLKMLDNGQSGSASVGAALIMHNQLYYAVVGNVKLCVFRAGELVPMSTGHTLDQLAEKGFQSGRISREDALTLLENHRLYNYIGQDEFQDVELYDTPIALKKGDIIVLMSDGLYDVLPWKNIEDILAAAQPCRTMAFDLIQQINQMEGEDKDNASLVLIRV